MTPSYRAAGVVSVIVFLLYLATLSPTIGLWDAGEYIAAAAGLGIPHPPGNPGFVILGHVVSGLPIAPSVAARLNVLVAIASALSAGLWFLVTEHITRNWLSPFRAQVVAAASALIGATAFTVWNHSVVNEKVYTISLFLLTLDIWAILRWQSQPDGTRADRRLVMLCYRLGIGYTIHIAGLLAGPALLAAVLYTRPATFLRRRLLLVCSSVFVLGLTPFVAMPIRAAFRLDINEGHPTACENGRPEWRCTVSRETLDRFLYQNSRAQYAKPSLLDRQQSMQNQLRMWWLYFKWQWFRDPTGSSPDWQRSLAVVMLLLAGLGGFTHWRTDPRTFVPFATVIATLTVGLIYYLNFKLGFSQAAAMNAPPGSAEARDRDYFFLWSYSALSVWIALGTAWLWRRFAEFAAGSDDDPEGAQRAPAKLHWKFASAVWVIALVPLMLNWNAASRRGETFPEDFAIDLLNSVEPNAVLFTGGDNDSFPLWFAQQVLGVRRDVTVVLLAYLATDWYPRELIAKHMEPYDPARGPRIYSDMRVSPTGPVLAMSRQEADFIPATSQIHSPSSVQLAGFTLTLPPSTLLRDEVIMLRIVRDAGQNRPIYFSAGAGSEFIDKRLGPHLITQGLARKVVPNPSAVPGATRYKEGYLDANRSMALWNTFRGPAALERQARWIDPASVNTPYTYMRLGFGLAEGPRSQRPSKEVAALRAQIVRIGRSIDFMRLVGGRQRSLDAPAGLGYAPVSGR